MFSPKTPVSSTNMSIAFWFKTNENTGKYFIDGGGFGVYFTKDPNTNTVGFTKIFGQTSSAHGIFLAGQWTNVIGTYDGTNIKIYMNGVLAETKSKPGSMGGFASNLILGFSNPVYCAGSIDDLFIYNRALSQTEVNTLYNLHK